MTRWARGMLEALKGVVARPEEMKADAYERTLKARAFDVARYCLPLATNTSVGQITNARTLETQVSRLLTSEFAEIRGLGEKMRAAATGPAWNVQGETARTVIASNGCGGRGAASAAKGFAAAGGEIRADAGEIRGGE